MFDRRSWQAWKFALTGWAGALILILGSELVFGRMGKDDFGTARVLIPTFTSALAIAWAFVMSVFAFRRLDEFHKEAGKFAWYWGGTIGVAVSVVGYAFVGLGGLHWLDPDRFHLGSELFHSFQIGYALGIGGPFVGFFAARLWWSLSKR